MTKLCGFHPFAIALNAAAASQGVPWPAIVTALQQHELDYVKHAFEEYVYATVEQSLEISLDALSKADRARYRELAAFYWDSDVPAVAIARFWKRRGRLADHRTLSLLVHLRQRSLLQLEGPPDRYEVRLHDLHVAHISRSEKKVVALGRTLLESYAPTQQGAWWTVPDDGYLRRSLMRHLLHARSAADARALLSADDSEGRNAWYRARVRGAGDGGFAGYVADLDRVSGVDEADVLVALIAASLRSLSRAVPAALLGAAVADGRLSANRAIAQARLIAEPDKRARALMALLAQAEDRDAWLDDTLAAIADAEVTGRRELMGALASSLEEAELLPVLRRVVGWARKAATPFDRNYSRHAVWPLLDRMPATLAAQALAAVDGLELTPLRLYTLLAEPERSARIHNALAKGRGRTDDVSVAGHAGTVSTLCVYLEPVTAAKLVAQALAGVRALKRSSLRFGALAELLPCLSAPEQQTVLDELIADARDDPSQFVELAREAPPALHAAIGAAVKDQPLAWVAAVAPLLAGEDRASLVDLALQGIEARSNAASLLWMDEAELILAMNDRQLDRARALIDARLEGDSRVRALIACARAGSTGHRARMLDDVLDAIDGLRDAEERERAYESVAPLLAPTQLAAALAQAERIGESGLAQVAKMLPHLSAAERERATGLLARQARAAGIVHVQAALRAIPAGADIGRAEALVELALGLDVLHGRAHLLSALVPRVEASTREHVAAHARAAIAQCVQAHARVELLLQIDDVDAAERELQAAGAAFDADQFARSVAQLARRLDAERAGGWVKEALQRGGGKHVLESLAQHLTAEAALAYLAELINPKDSSGFLPLARAMDPDLPHVHDDDAASTAAALARRLGEWGRADDAFELLLLGADDAVTTMGLVALAPWLSRVRVREVVRRANAAKLGNVMVPVQIGRRGIGRDYLEAQLAPALARIGELDLARRYADAADEAWCIDAHLGIAAATTGDERSRALERTLDVLLRQRDVYRSEQIDDVAHALALDRPSVRRSWAAAVAWAREHPRDEAIEVLASLAPVAVAVGGTPLVDEVFRAVERVVRWWP